MLLNLAVLFGDRNDCVALAEVLDACERISTMYWAPSVYRRRVPENLRAACQARGGEIDGVEPVLLSTFESLRAELGAENRYTRLAARNLAEMYEASGRPGQAETYRSVASAK